MIKSKPKGSTLFSLGIFLLIDIALVVVTFNAMSNAEAIYWYHYLFLVILIPIGTVVLVKVLLGYKITTIQKGKIETSYPVKFKRESYLLREIEQWREETIKTASGVYQQLEILFNNNKKLTIGKQEHTNYERIKNYLSKKASKKRVK